MHEAADTFDRPLPLRELVRAIVGRETLPNGTVAVKIMRRTAVSGNKVSNEGSTAASSSVPSKATSETGAENTSDEGMPSPPDTSSSKDRSKWTREEKEAHYKAARERIFRDFQEAQPTANTTADTSTNMSRSSSSSGKKKGPKQKVPRDDSFEARSSYVPGFVGMPYVSPPNRYGDSYSASGHQSPYGPQTPNSMPMMPFGPNPAPAPGYNQYDPSAAFPGINFTAAYPNHCGSTDGWSNIQSPQPGPYYNFVQPPGPSYPQYASAMPPPVNQYPQIASPAFPSPGQPGQQWGQVQFQPPYQAQAPPPAPPPMQVSMAPNSGPVPWPGYASHPHMPSAGPPYQLGPAAFPQYSSTPPPPPMNQHPLPGSYTRPAFNPQIRSFVPSGPNPRFGVPAGQQGRATNSYFTAQAGSSSNNNNMSANAENVNVVEAALRAQSAAAAATMAAQESLQKKWGTPAHLPKKPPTSQVPSPFEVENTPPPMMTTVTTTTVPSRSAFPTAMAQGMVVKGTTTSAAAVGNN
jgi:SUZ domain